MNQMAFDEIPEDREESFQCAEFDDHERDSYQCRGSVKLIDGRWKCNKCDTDYGASKQPDFEDM